MNRILFLIVPIFLLAICSCSRPFWGEMNSYIKAGVGADFPETDPRTGRGSDNDPAIGNHGGVGTYIHLGPVVLGIEGKSVAPDPSSRFGDVKPNRAVIFGIGFPF